MRFLLKGARVVDPSIGLDAQRDILIEDRRIKELVFKAKKLKGTKIIDLNGMVIVPGLIDMHTHLREPGYEYKETIDSGTTSALYGGFSAVACMANTLPVNDTASVTEYILERAKLSSKAKVYPIGAISKGLKGKELAELAELAKSGCRGFSDDGYPVMDSDLMRRALEYAKALDRPIISHPEDLNLSGDGVMNEGAISTVLGLSGIPSSAEEVMVARDIILAKFTGAKLHLAHLSCKGSVELVRRAKDEGIQITAETAPHYFTLTDEAVRDSGYDPNTKIKPPLRTQEDKEAIIEGIKDGTIDVIASDHAPHQLSEKEVEFQFASFGIVGLETSLGLSLELVHKGIISLGTLVEKMSTNPAKILGVEGGTLRPGSLADLTVIDLNRKWKVDITRFHSMSRNSPFSGFELTGKALQVWVSGKQFLLDD